MKYNTKFNTEIVFGVSLFVAALFLPAVISSYKASLFASFLFNIIMCFSITLIWGYGGSFSFGQSAFFGLGAYAYGAIAGNMENLALAPVGLLIAVVAVGLFALFLGYFMFYGGVNDVFVGIITLCVTLALNMFFAQTAGDQYRIGNMRIGGYNGMTGIPSLYIGNVALKGYWLYYAGVILVFAIAFGFIILRHSKLGYTIFAVRENRSRSMLFGYNVPQIQTLLFAVGGAMAALGGGLYGAWGNYVAPSTMNMTQATIPVVLVASGGRKSPIATIMFAFLYYYTSNRFAATGNEYALIILGVALIVVMLFIPQGLCKALFDSIDGLVNNRLMPNRREKSKRGILK